VPETKIRSEKEIRDKIKGRKDLAEFFRKHKISGITYYPHSKTGEVLELGLNSEQMALIMESHTEVLEWVLGERDTF
jgi:hypothetical protein